ncbi:hypothetical protein P7L95_09945 [Bisgaard Taxon 10/6]|uniref:hypothetical protein n=1 Tax=Exercitatus varius TaxID=67857 RepID=UPI00294B6AA6|nr:hypothetical protein [Exercitatus varius]MDG2957063.1 hypothetical protein [Exercitatus varius]MDG2965249.1 hypothetical protein [Exercitatus varius]
MKALMLLLNLACIGSAVFLMWICYKREQKFYLSATAISAIFYQLLYIELSPAYSSLIISITYLGLLWTLIKAYSNLINKEYNDKLLETMKADLKKYAVKPKRPNSRR